MCLPTGALCCTWTCLSARIFAAPVRVCRQELCAVPGRACLQEFLLHLCVSVYKSFVTHLDVSANKSAAQAVTVGVLLKIFGVCFGLFRNSSVCFGCFDIGSKHQNKPKYFCFLFHETNRNKPKQTRNRSCFGLFRFEPKFIFVCFEDTLLPLHALVRITVMPTLMLVKSGYSWRSPCWWEW